MLFLFKLAEELVEFPRSEFFLVQYFKFFSFSDFASDLVVFEFLFIDDVFFCHDGPCLVVLGARMQLLSMSALSACAC